MYSYSDMENAIEIRLMFYTNDFNENERDKIKEFKQLCIEKGIKIPENDPEILRFLYSRKMNP